MRNEFTSTETDSLPGQVREHCDNLIMKISLPSFRQKKHAWVDEHM